MKFTVLSNELKAASYFASKDCARYLLQGVNIEVKDGQAPIVSATDGRRIITLKSQAVQEPDMGIPENGCNIIIEAECLTIIQKLFPGDAPLIISPNERSVTVVCQSVKFMHLKDIEFTHRLGLVEGDFPKFRMVIPNKRAKRTPIPSIGVNPALAATLDKVAKALHLRDNSVEFQFVDSTSVIVIKFTGCPYAWAGVMPIRLDSAIELWEPHWLEIPTALVEATQPKV